MEASDKKSVEAFGFDTNRRVLVQCNLILTMCVELKLDEATMKIDQVTVEALEIQ